MYILQSTVLRRTCFFRNLCSKSRGRLNIFGSKVKFVFPVENVKKSRHTAEGNFRILPFAPVTLTKCVQETFMPPPVLDLINCSNLTPSACTYESQCLYGIWNVFRKYPEHMHFYRNAISDVYCLPDGSYDVYFLRSDIFPQSLTALMHIYVPKSNFTV